MKELEEKIASLNTKIGGLKRRKNPNDNKIGKLLEKKVKLLVEQKEKLEKLEKKS